MTSKSLADQGAAKKIAEILLNSSRNEDKTPEGFKENWFVISSQAVDLLINVNRIKEIKDDLMRSRLDAHSAMTSVIQEWTKRNRGNASLDKLTAILSTNCFDADEIKKTFLAKPEISGENASLSVPGSSRPSSTFTSTPTESALTNTVILREIFKQSNNFCVEDLKSCRLVNPLWRKQSLPLWRKEAWLTLIGNDRFPTNKNRTISLKDFFGLFQKQPNEEWTEETFDLVRHPYFRVKLIDELLTPQTEEMEEVFSFFWDFYGAQLTHLRLHYCSFAGMSETLELIESILLDKCPNLEEFEINCKFEEDEDDDESFIEENEVEEGANKRAAEKLKKFSFVDNEESFDEEVSAGFQAFKKIINMAPNLKELKTDGALDIQELLFPTLLSKSIPLQKLKIYSNFRLYVTTAPCESFLAYVKVFPNSLKELDLRLPFLGLKHKEATSNFFKALASANQSLEVLHLHYTESDENDYDWFTDMRGISLPNVKEFNIEFENIVIRFDWLTLKGMPRLESFEIEQDNRNSENMERSPGKLDWICENPEVQFDYEGFENVNISGEPWSGNMRLRRLSFKGWPLNPEDVGILHRLFPNLEYLEAILNQETLPLVCTSWENIKSVRLDSRSEEFPDEVMDRYKAQFKTIQIDRTFVHWFKF